MKTKLTKKVAAFVAVCAGLFASCEKPAVEPVEPTFPEFEEVTLNPGETATLEIGPNMAWSVSVPAETLEWIWIDRDGEKLATVKGTEGKTGFVIAASDAKDFEIRSVDVTMTMGGQTKKIATVTKNAIDRVITIYNTKTDEDGWIEGEYEETPATSLEMVFDGSAFVCREMIKVVANFDFALAVDMPEWISAYVNEEQGKGTGAKVNPETGLAEIIMEFRGNTAALPLEDATGKIVILDTDTQEEAKSLDITCKGVKDFMYVEAFDAEFNAEGQCKSAMGEFTDMPKTVWVTATAGSKAYAVYEKEGWYYTGGASDGWSPESGDPAQMWVEMTMETADETVLCDYTLKISADANDGDAREAQVIVLPAFIAKEITDPDTQLFNEEGNAIKEEYHTYIKGTLSQAGADGGETGSEAAWPALDEAGLAAMGVMYEKVDAGNPTNSWANWVSGELGVPSSAVYQMTLNKNANVAFDFSKEVWDTGIFDGELAQASGWCEFMGDGLSIWFEEGVEYYEGYVVLKDESGVNFAIIKVVYDISAEISGGALISFSYPDFVSGATLEKLTEGEIFEFWNSETTVDGEVYLLTYTTAEPAMAMLKVPELNYDDMMSGDGVINWNDDAWLTCEPGSDFMVTMTEAGKYGAIVFKKGWMNFCTLVCTRTE